MSDLINDEVESNLAAINVPVPTPIELPVAEEETPLATISSFTAVNGKSYELELYNDRIMVLGDELPQALYFVFAEDVDGEFLPGGYRVYHGKFRNKPPFDFDYNFTTNETGMTISFTVMEVLTTRIESRSNKHGSVLDLIGSTAILPKVDLPEVEVTVDNKGYISGTKLSLYTSNGSASPHTGNPKDLIGDTKADLSLVPPAASLYLAAGFADGAQKYGPYNWRENKVKARVYVAAAMRHLAQYLDGENVDPTSHVPHIGHALSCLAIIADATETGNLIDDRPKAGAASDLIRRYNSDTKFS